MEDGPVLLAVRHTYDPAYGGRIQWEPRLDAATPGPPGRAALHGTKECRDWDRQVYPLRWAQGRDVVHLTAFHNWALDGAMFWACWQEEGPRRDQLLIGAVRPSLTVCHALYQPLVVSCGQDVGRHVSALSLPVQEGERHFFLSVVDRRAALPIVGSPGSRVEALHRQVHCLGLDEYHHMSLEWEGMQEARFPHPMMAPDELPQVRRALSEWPWLRQRVTAHVEDRLFATHDQHDMRILSEVRTLGSDWAGAYLATGQVEYARRAKAQIGERPERWVRELAAVGPTVDQLIGITLARPWRATCIAFDLVAGSEAFSAALLSGHPRQRE